jgi:hypothetical protein
MQQGIEAAPHRLYGPIAEVVQDRLINYLGVADMAILAGEVRPGGTAERQIREGVALAKAVLAMPPQSAVSSQDTPPPPRPEPRVWREGDPEPEDVTAVIGERTGRTYRKGAIDGQPFGWIWPIPGGGWSTWSTLLATELRATEVLPSVSTDPGGGDR